MATYVGTGVSDPGDDLTVGSHKLGIGTTSPTYNVDIAGSSYPVLRILSTDSAGGDLMLTSASKTWEMYLEGNDLKFDDGGTTRVTFQSGGNVGIGSTSPSCKLDVAGTFKASTAVITPAVKPASDSSSAVQIQKSDGTSVVNVDTTNERVGIGTTSPSSLLELRKDAGSAIGPILALNNKAGSGNTAIYLNGYDVGANDPAAAIKSIDGNWSAHLTFSTKVPGNAENGLTERVRIQNDGYVGIGSSSPSCALDVVGSVCLANSADFARLKCYTYSAADKCVALSMMRSNSNTLGTKTTTIDAKRLGLIEWFGVNDNATPDFAKGAQMVVTQDGSPGTDYIPARIEFMVATSSSDIATAMTIKNNGAVGIGTTTPGQTLDVNGNIKASGSVQVGNNTDTASASLVGALRYRVVGSTSYLQVCMQTGAGSYSWETILSKSW